MRLARFAGADLWEVGFSQRIRFQFDGFSIATFGPIAVRTAGGQSVVLNWPDNASDAAVLFAGIGAPLEECVIDQSSGELRFSTSVYAVVIPPQSEWESFELRTDDGATLIVGTIGGEIAVFEPPAPS